MTIHPQAKQVAWHVGYEIWIFSEGVRSYNPGIRGSQRFQHNLILESILVHARVIYEFLFIKPKRPDDVRTEDVFDDPIRWSPNKSELCPFLAENLVRLNRSLQHLSFGRLKFSPNLWDVQAMRAKPRTAGHIFSASCQRSERSGSNGLWKVNVWIITIGSWKKSDHG